MTDSLWCWFLWNQKQFTSSASAPLIKTGMCVFASLFSWINNQLLGFVDVEQEIIFCASLTFSLLRVIIIWNLAGAFYNCLTAKSQYYKIFWFSWSFNCTITDVPLIVFTLYKHSRRFSDPMLGWKDASQHCDWWDFHKVEKTFPFMT